MAQDNELSRLDKAQKLFAEHLLLVSVILILLLVIAELTLKPYADNDFVNMVLSVIEALITAAFAGCVVEWLMKRRYTQRDLLRAHQRAIFSSIQDGMCPDFLSAEECLRLATESICSAYSLEGDSRGLVKVAVNEIAFKVDGIFWQNLHVNREYFYMEENGVKFLRVVDTQQGNLCNNTHHETTYKLWGTLTSDVILGAPGEINDYLLITQNVYHDGGTTPVDASYTINKESLKREDVEDGKTRQWVNNFCPICLPPRTTYSIEFNREFNIPYDERSTIFDWGVAGQRMRFDVRFIDVEVNIEPTIASCILCNKPKSCYTCTNASNPCRIESHDNEASIVLSDWVGTSTNVRFAWSYI